MRLFFRARNPGELASSLEFIDQFQYKQAMKVLIVKLSSMGDLIHTLPAITDAARERPGIQFDWVAEEAFSEIPRWHPAVHRVIQTATRRWKKNIRGAWTSGELKQFFSQLRAEPYDLIIDAQSNLKSAVVTRLARGVRWGYDKESVCEKGAHFAYQKTVYVSRQCHAVDRLRYLFAKVLDYRVPQTPPTFGIEKKCFPALSLSLPKEYVVFVPNTTWATKHWPDHHWRTLIQQTVQTGVAVVLPWHGEKEKARVERLAAGIEGAQVLPPLNLSSYLPLMQQAQAIVSGDTGLGHLAASLNRPLITLYGPTDSALVGVVGPNSVCLSASFECLKCYKKMCRYEHAPHTEAVCMQRLLPEQVWEVLEKKLSNARAKTFTFSGEE